MFSPKFLVNANEASKNVDVINENFRNIKVDLEYLNDLDKRISDIDARTKCVNPERIRRDYLLTKSELEAKANLAGGNTFSGKQSISASSATEAGINFGGTGTAPSSPVDGDFWKTATALFVRIASTTHQLAMLAIAQTWSAVQTFSSTPVISSTTAASTAGAMYRASNRGLVDYELIARLRRGIIFQGTTASSTITGSEALLPIAASFGTLTLPANLLQAGTKLVVTVYVRVTAWTSGQIYVRCRLGSNNSTADTIFAQTAVGGSTGIFPVQFIVAPIAAPGASVTCFGGAINLDGYAGSSSSNSYALATNATLYLNVGALTSGGTLTATATIQSVEIA